MSNSTKYHLAGAILVISIVAVLVTWNTPGDAAMAVFTIACFAIGACLVAMYRAGSTERRLLKARRG
jgi:hypothetical protein